MSGRKITFIGAGSAVFASKLLKDILGIPELSDSTICLFDIDEDRLRLSHEVGKGIASRLGANPVFEVTTDRQEALVGADYAITMIQVGGYRPCTVTDFEIPKRYGLRQTIGDTIGIGGIMRGLRTLPPLLEIAADMERLCPDVLHLNYANPMAINCWGLGRASPVRTVGLCHSVQHTVHELAADIGVPEDEIDYLAAGINHLSFFLRFERAGRDLYPLIHRVQEEERVPDHNRVRYDLLKRFGYFVTESSEHLSEYTPWYLKSGREDLVERFNIPVDEYLYRCQAGELTWDLTEKELFEPGSQDAAILARTLAETPLMPTIARAIVEEFRSLYEPGRSVEYAASIIRSVETGDPTVIYGNVLNRGLIDNLPTGCCVEVPCLVDRNGVQPTRIGALPPHLAALMQTNINVQALTVEAVLTENQEHVYHAAMLDPHTAADLSPDEIWSLVDDLLRAHAEWLPPSLQGSLALTH